MTTNSRFSELDSLGLRLVNSTATDGFRAKQGDAVVANLGSLFSDATSARGVGIGMLQVNEEDGTDLSRNNLSINISVAPENQDGGEGHSSAVIKLNTAADSNTYDDEIDSNAGVYLLTTDASLHVKEAELIGESASNITFEAGNRALFAGADGQDMSGAALDLSGNAKLSADDTLELNARDGDAKLTLDDNAVLQTSGEVTIKHNDGNDTLVINDGEVALTSDTKVVSMIDADNKIELTASQVLLDHDTQVRIDTTSNIQTGSTVSSIGNSSARRLRVNSAGAALIHDVKVLVESALLDVDASVDIDGANLDADLTGSNKQYATGETRIGREDGKELFISDSRIFLDHTRVDVQATNQSNDISYVTSTGHGFTRTLVGGNTQTANSTTIGQASGNKEINIRGSNIRLKHTDMVLVDTATFDVDATTVDMDATDVQIDATASVLVNAQTQLKLAESGESNFLDLSAGDAALVTGTGELAGVTQMTVTGCNSTLDLSSNAKLESAATIELEATSNINASASNFVGDYVTLNKQYAATTKVGITGGTEMVVDSNSIKLDHSTKVHVETGALDMDAATATLDASTSATFTTPSFTGAFANSNVQTSSNTVIGADVNNRMVIDAAKIQLDHATKVHVDTGILDMDAATATLDATTSATFTTPTFTGAFADSNVQTSSNTFIGMNSDTDLATAKNLRIQNDDARLYHTGRIYIQSSNNLIKAPRNKMVDSAYTATNYIEQQANELTIKAGDGLVDATNFDISAGDRISLTKDNGAGTSQTITLEDNLVLESSSNAVVRAAEKIVLARDQDDENAVDIAKIELNGDNDEQILAYADKGYHYMEQQFVVKSGDTGAADVLKADVENNKVTIADAGLANRETETLLVNGSAKITGKLEVAGDLTYRSVVRTQLDLSDNILRLNFGGGEVNDAGFIFADVSSEDPKHAAFVYDASPGADAFVCQYVSSSVDSGGANFVDHDPESEFNNLDVTNLADFRAKTILCKRVKAASDARLKKNVEEFANAMEQVKKLRPVWYNWKKDEDSVGKEMGFIAQEIEEEIPSLVHTEASGMKSVEYAKMVALLTKALQEQQEQIDALRAEVAELKKD